MRNVVYIALGSNIGERHETLKSTIELIDSHLDIELLKCSSIYETEPVGYVEQPSFLNMVIKVKTNLSAIDTLTFLQHVEHNFGRKREEKWGPRTLDLDILLYNQENIETDVLIVPHPRMWERSFVLVPLIEIADEQDIPKYIDKKTLLELQDREGVQVWKPKSGEDEFGHTEN
ncbi:MULTISPECIES: 2-amino-4-hydroxy-6-hydroxymethyldihydropteridine diphosphokinase [Bacillus]|uniref:2-amino-4-hydroxy-6- hydroxymethyldihydropteridine diphosphokinase n=1 Tax=Bacillus TaxID=1386 RepID=UPI000BB97F9B|nr:MULTISPECIES: 2-amino-4-hydroxy-6-hydroxymethyldihydropteridine diphosphokinase [Bacillus]